MGVAVLPPQDCLRNHHLHRQPVYPANKPRRNPNNPNPNPNSVRSSCRRRNSPPPPSAGWPPRARSPPIMSQIRILKRGEDLFPPTPTEPTQPVVSDLPKPNPMPDGFYAGSAFVTSPPPSSLPLPVFFTGRRNCWMSEARDPVAESVLRRVLKLQ